MADDPLQECPVCEGHIRRVVNSVGVIFKGKGFYITDSRGGKNATLKTNGKDAGSEGDKPDTEGKAKDEKADKATSVSKADSPTAQSSASA